MNKKEPKYLASFRWCTNSLSLKSGCSLLHGKSLALHLSGQWESCSSSSHSFSRIQRPWGVFWESQQQSQRDEAPTVDEILDQSLNKRFCGCKQHQRAESVVLGTRRLKAELLVRPKGCQPCRPIVSPPQRSRGRKTEGGPTADPHHYTIHPTALLQPNPGWVQVCSLQIRFCCLGTPSPPGRHFLLVSRRNIVKSAPKASYPQKLPFRTLRSLHFHLQNLLLGLFDNANSHLLS